MMQYAHSREGYPYLRDRSRGNDSTVYLHQLGALLAGESGYDIWAVENEVHHVVPVPEWWGPDNVEVVSVEEHENRHGRGGSARPPLRVVRGEAGD